jgi:membrane-bound serine protease (ClpP class)
MAIAGTLLRVGRQPLTVPNPMNSSRAPRTLAVGVCLALVALGAAGRGATQPTRPIVYVISIDGIVDLGLAPFLARTIREAQQDGAAAVLLDINTFGGRVDAAVAMRDSLVDSPVRTIAYVHPRAISAGALIALAAETIVMASGGTIGAATPVLGGSGPPQAADEKTVSYMRKEFGATAERRKRPALFAEAMVDADVEIAGVVEKGKLLTLSSTEAIQHKVAEHTADTLDAALAAAGLPDAELRRATQTWAETLVRFLTNPVVNSLLMTVGLLGILVEIRTPGFAVPGTIGVLFLGLFFWGQWLVQLAGWEELLLVLLGVVLLGVEVFVLPGFGVAGIGGILALVAGLGLAMVGAGATVNVIIGALGRVAISLLIALGGGLLLLRFLPHLPFGRRLVLDTEMPADAGYSSEPAADHQLLRRSGIALSPLRPSGVAEIDGARVDVVSDGTFVDAGAAVEVIRVDGNRIVVRQLRRAHSETE